ncbi:hypothetical protein C6P46_001947 [Rhodotorula mucilaginosa]|uniref:Ferritin-like domain-containing protein n=1 Tax=Rhodotorula mucilaginosa TaxID=5537 RepID=A0A9P6VUC1_RHOMI|nr:hypothetical protein C6P46_001947 [Rhodotorula mucilaginosa]TKA56672.1 hypothetical protein B0A53_01867 [Rhodotorula sp. CCFEE 5036]
MARFALLSLGLALALACIAPVASSESPAPDSVGLLERRRSEQGGRQPRHEARSQHGTASTSYASDTSTYQSAQYYTPVNDQKSASGVAYASSSKTSEPAAAAVSTTTGWTSAAGSSSSAGAGGGAATLSSYASSSTSAMSPAPSSTAAAASPQSVDIVVLQLAVVLEAFEGSFYREGLKKFGLVEMMNAGLSRVQALIIIEQIQIIIVDEQNHFDALSSALVALGAQPPAGCGFDFSKALSDPLTFLATARSIEAVGVSAYLGAAHLLESADLLEAAGSILTLEARHQSLLNVLNGGSYDPQSFDIQLTPQAVLALAGGFLTGCEAKDLGLTANQPLSVRSSDGTNVYRTGSQLVFEVVDVNVQIETLFCQMTVGGSPVAFVAPANACYVPSGLDGPVAVYLTSNDTPLASDVVIQNQLTTVAGPGLIFVDEQITILAVLLGPAGGNNGNGTAYRTLPCVDLGGWAVDSMRQLGSSASSSTWSTGASGWKTPSSWQASESTAGASSKTDSATISQPYPTYRMTRRHRRDNSHRV